MYMFYCEACVLQLFKEVEDVPGKFSIIFTEHLNRVLNGMSKYSMNYLYRLG